MLALVRVEPDAGQGGEQSDRVGANELFGAWIERQAVRPSERTCGIQSAAAKRICEQYRRKEIRAAWAGMELIFPYAPPPVGRGEGWSLTNMEARFHDAAREAVRRHPAMRQARQQQDAADFAALTRSMGYG